MPYAAASLLEDPNSTTAAKMQTYSAQLMKGRYTCPVSRTEVCEMRMRGITDNMPALIAHIDRDERYLFVNAMGADIFGIDVDAMVGRTVREVRGESIYAQMREPIAAALRGETVSFEGESVVNGNLRRPRSSRRCATSRWPSPVR